MAKKFKYKYKYVGRSKANLPSHRMVVKPGQEIKTNIRIDNPLYKSIK